MKTRFLEGLAIGLGVGVVVTFLVCYFASRRYELIQTNRYTVYRIDTWSGKTWLSDNISEWEPIEEAK